MGTVFLTAEARHRTHSEVIYQDPIFAWKEERNGLQIWEKTAEQIYFLKRTELPVNDIDMKENGEWSMHQVTSASYCRLQRGIALTLDIFVLV